MDRESIYLACLTGVTTAIMICAAHNIIKFKRNRKQWSRQWIQRRIQGKGVLNMLDEELKEEDPAAYRNFLRLTNKQFEHLLSLVSPLISKRDTAMRESISARNKLEVTLRFLASGETFRSLMYSTRIHESTISRFIPIVCSSISSVLKDDYLKIPSDVTQWEQVSSEFNALWQFPNCIGALDGRHIKFRSPISTGSFYYNYKGTKSIVLLGLVDAKYKFLYVNIGVNGHVSDGGVFNQSGLARAIDRKTLNLPPPTTLPGQETESPYVIVADAAFPLSEHIMKPYPHRRLAHDEKIFNYRLSRARRVVENAFGILANRFRVLLNPIGFCVDKVETITLTCVLLHNYLATMNGNRYTDIQEDVPQLRRIGSQSGNRSSNLARDIRNTFKNFFNSPLGSVGWQQRAVQNSNY